MNSIKTRTWETLEIFDMPVGYKNKRFVDSPLCMPEGVDDLIRANWDVQLENKQEQLGVEGIATEIRPYHIDDSERPLNAL